MRRIVFLLITFYVFTNQNLFSQWRLGIGAGFNYISDAGSRIHNIYEGKNIYNLYIPVSLHYNPSWSEFIELSASYQLKRNLFFLKSQFFFSQMRTTNNYVVNQYNEHYFGNSLVWSSTQKFNKMGFALPFCYGFSIIKWDKKYAIYPYVGISNNFVWTQNRIEMWSDITVVDNGSEYQLTKGDEFGGSSVITYYLSSIFGLRFRYKGLYVDFAYKRQLFQKNQSEYDITYQTVNLSLGYVYTFKTKAERQKPKE